jgi:hypothetical protein
VGVEQQGLGVRVIMGVFYEIKALSCVPEGNSGGSKIGSDAVLRQAKTLQRVLVPMKLGVSMGHG